MSSRLWWLLAAALFAATLFTTTTLGAGWYLATRTDVTTDLPFWLAPETVRRVWSDPALVATGLAFSLPVIVILLAHELGHWIPCRLYGLPSTPPLFLPAPFGLGTLGAFIRIRAPIRDRRQLLDVGAGGPLAGVAALTPFLLYGIARSQPAVVSPADPGQARLLLLVPGDSLAVSLLGRWFHGELAPDAVLDLHPFALAAWVGLLVTALNLLPLGQLDGGHVLYAATGRLQRRLALPLWLALAVAGLWWSGWWIWCVLLLAMGLRHPPVRNEAPGLGPPRVAVAVACLAIFVLAFMPVPLDLVGLAE